MLTRGEAVFVSIGVVIIVVMIVVVNVRIG